MVILAALIPGLDAEPTHALKEYVEGEPSAETRVEDLYVNVCLAIKVTLTLAVFKVNVMKIQIVDLRGLVRTTNV